MIIGLVEETMKGRVGRSPIRLRSPPDWIAFAARSDGVRSTMTFAIILHNISIGFISHKWGI